MVSSAFVSRRRLVLSAWGWDVPPAIRCRQVSKYEPEGNGCGRVVSLFILFIWFLLGNLEVRKASVNLSVISI